MIFKATVTILIAFLLCLPNRTVIGQTDSKPTDSAPALQPVFSDDFRSDTRGDYEIEGDVPWKPGELTLSEGASIKRSVDGGSWAKVELELGNATFPPDKDTAELRIWFLMDGASDCFVRLRKNEDGQPASVAVFDMAPQKGLLSLLASGLTEELVRETTLREGVPHRITITYRNGLVVVKADQSELLKAHIDNGVATVTGSRLQTAMGSYWIDRWMAASRPASPPLTEEQQQQAKDAASANRKMVTLYRQGQLAEATAIGERALNLRKSVLGDEHPDYAQSLNNLAGLYRLMGDYQRAEPLLVQARNIQKQVVGVEHPDYANCLNNLAELYESMGDYRQAEPLLVQACEIRKQVLGENHPSYALGLSSLGSLYESTGDYGRAEPLLMQSCNIRKQVLGEGHPDYAMSLNNLGSLYDSMGDYSRAEKLHLQAREIRKRVLGEEHPNYAQSLNNLASVYEAIGDSARAEPLYVQSRDILRKAYGEEHPHYAASLNNLASLYESMGDFAQAEPLYMQSRDVLRRIFGEEHPLYAASLNNLAGMYKSMNDHARAKTLLVEACDIQKKIYGEEHPSYATGLNNLAYMYRSMGDYERAEPLLVQSLQIARKSLGEEHPDYAQSLSNLGSLYESMGDYGRAEPLNLEARRVLSAAAERALPSLSEAQALSWMRKHGPPVGSVLSDLRRQQKWESPEAYAAVWECKGLVRRLRVGQSLSPNAPPGARAALAELRDARRELARLVTMAPSPEQAETYLQTLSAANERKEVLEKKLAEVNAATARELAIRDAKVGDLIQRLPEGVAVVDFVRVHDTRDVETEVKFTNEAGDTETRTVIKSKSTPVYDAFLMRSKPSAGANPVKWIPLGLAEPIDSAVRQWRARLTGNATLRGLGTKSQVVDNSEDPFVESVDSRVMLRQSIWDKLEPQLEGIHTVVIVPDGDLTRLPWAALPGRNDGDYLVHDYALTTASSGQQLYGALADPPIETEPQVLVVGGIDYDNRPPESTAESGANRLAAAGRPLIRSENESGWSKLPGTERETAAIIGLWGDRGAVKELKSNQADERSLARLLPKFRFAHLATHGFFDTQGEVYGTNLREQNLFDNSTSRTEAQFSAADRNPLLMTGIVMAGANVPLERDGLGLPIGDDGILTAEEISGLDLRDTELVTLSACETGLGDVAAGQGVYGLTRVLHQSGVRSVVASQWKVDDRATQELMREFYKNLWIEKMSKIDALREAQLSMIRGYDPQEGVVRGLGDMSIKVDRQSIEGSKLDPFYWAAFQLSGDWR